MDKIVYVEHPTGIGPAPWRESQIENAFAKGFRLCDPQPANSGAVVPDLPKEEPKKAPLKSDPED